jgi:two-component system CheB/CheR fusion protein
VGRPIGDLVSNLNYTTLEGDAQDVLRTLVSKEIDIPTPEGQWYFMRMMPYRTADNVIDGLVLTFVDITLQKQAELESREALVILDAELRVVSANRAFYRMFQQTADGVVGEPFFYLSGGAWAHAERQRLLRDILDSGSIFEDFQLDHTFPDIGAKNLRLNARRVARTPGLSPLILLTIEDRTDRPYPRADTMPVMRALVPSEESCDDAT